MVADQKVVNKEQLFKLMDNNNTTENNGPTIGKRHVQIILCFLIICTNYLGRISMSVLIVAMTDPTVSPNKDIPTYNWTDKSLILTSFMWGYMIPQIAAGYLATVFGAKWFLTMSVLASSVLGLFIPLIAATLGSNGLMAIRILQGLSQSFMFPAIHAFLGKWVPLQERSRLGSLPYVGANFGTVGAMLISGHLASTSYGWPMVLYLFGIFGIITGILFACFAASEPDLHPTISEQEKNYIQNNISEDGNESAENVPVPWSEIFTSIPFWALIIAQIGFSWGNYTLLFETPSYLNHVMKFDLKSNSLLSALPYIAEAALAMVYSCIADCFIVKKIFSIATTRKILNSWGILFEAIFLVLIANCGSNNQYKAVLYLIIIGAAGGSIRSGYNVNQIDLSPNFSGVLMGISNGLTAAVCSLGPLVVHLLVKNENDVGQWQGVFYIAAGLSIVCLIFNLIFGSGSVQPWNKGSIAIREKYQEVPLKV